MAKYVKNSFSLEKPPRALPPLTCLWHFTVPSNPVLAVPDSPTIPAHTFNLIATKLKEIDKFHVQQRLSKMNFLFNGLSRFLIKLKQVRVFLSWKNCGFQTKKYKLAFYFLSPKLFTISHWNFLSRCGIVMCLFGEKIEFFQHREHTQNLVVPPSPCPIQPRSPLLLEVFVFIHCLPDWC